MIYQSIFKVSKHWKPFDGNTLPVCEEFYDTEATRYVYLTSDLHRLCFDKHISGSSVWIAAPIPFAYRGYYNMGVKPWYHFRLEGIIKATFTIFEDHSAELVGFGLALPIISIDYGYISTESNITVSGSLNASTNFA